MRNPFIFKYFILVLLLLFGVLNKNVKKTSLETTHLDSLYHNFTTQRTMMLVKNASGIK
jgi:hypothetical protein